MAQSSQPASGLHRRVLRAGGTCWLDDLYKAYEAWAKEAGITFSQQKLTVRRNIKRRGYKFAHGNKGDKIIGLQLKVRHTGFRV